MNKIRGLVVGVLLAVWCFPALSSAKALPPEPAAPAWVAAGTTATGTGAGSSRTSSTASSTDSQSASFAQREQQATNLQNFKGGSAVIFIGSGTVLILLIVLLILLI
jgi:hypothetical protein